MQTCTGIFVIFRSDWKIISLLSVSVVITFVSACLINFLTLSPHLGLFYLLTWRHSWAVHCWLSCDFVAMVWSKKMDSFFVNFVVFPAKSWYFLIYLYIVNISVFYCISNTRASCWILFASANCSAGLVIQCCQLSVKWCFGHIFDCRYINWWR